MTKMSLVHITSHCANFDFSQSPCSYSHSPSHLPRIYHYTAKLNPGQEAPHHQLAGLEMCNINMLAAEVSTRSVT